MTGTRRTLGRRNGLALASIVMHVAASAAQTVAVSSAGDLLHVRVSRLRFIEGAVLDRLRDGRSVAVEFDLSVLVEPEGASLWQGRQRFSLSFDLWEERFAVSKSGTPPRSISHLTARDAESWCLENLVIPRGALASLGRAAPFWIRLTFEVDDPSPPARPPEDPRLSLRTLIDLLGRRTAGDTIPRTVNAGPFRMPG